MKGLLTWNVVIGPANSGASGMFAIRPRLCVGARSVSENTNDDVLVALVTLAVGAIGWITVTGR